MNKKDKLIVIGKGYPKKNLFLTGGDMTYGAVGTAANAAADVLDKSFINKGAHNKVGDVLNTVSDIMPAWTPYTLLAKGILKTAGIVANGLTNSANEQQVKQKGLEIANFANQTSNATDYNQLQQDYDVLQHQNVDLGKIDDWGSAGFLSSGSKRKNAFNNAKTAYDTAFRMRKDGLSQRGQNINLNNTMLQMQNLSAFGGPLFNGNNGNDMSAVDYGFMSDYLTEKKRQNDMKNKMMGMTQMPAFINSYAEGGTFGGGSFYGSGAGGGWDEVSTDTYNVDNFNQAFDLAVADGLKEFIFQGRRYNTQKENNPVREYNNRWVGQGRRANKKNPSKTYDHQAGPLGGPLAGVPMVTDTYIGTPERPPQLEYNPNAMERGKALPYSWSYAVDRAKRIEPVKAFGGPLFALGGDIQSHGSDWSTGLTHIDAGESHEMNPNEGVQMGIDSEGVPNLVEEGETVFNDYVYSTRIPIDDTTKKRFHIGKKSEMTYADLSKKLEKEVSERPNDPISQAAFKAQMAALAEEQERQKAEMEAERAREAFEALSPEEQTALMQQAAQQEQMAQEQAMQEQVMAEQAAAEQQPTPEEIAMAEQQQQIMQADGSEAALGQAPQMACGGKINKFDKGGVLKFLNKLGYKTVAEAEKAGWKPSDFGDYKEWKEINSNSKLSDNFAWTDEFSKRLTSPEQKAMLSLGWNPTAALIGRKWYEGDNGNNIGWTQSYEKDTLNAAEFKDYANRYKNTLGWAVENGLIKAPENNGTISMADITKAMRESPDWKKTDEWLYSNPANMASYLGMARGLNPDDDAKFINKWSPWGSFAKGEDGNWTYNLRSDLTDAERQSFTDLFKKARTDNKVGVMYNNFHDPDTITNRYVLDENGSPVLLTGDDLSGYEQLGTYAWGDETNGVNNNAILYKAKGDKPQTPAEKAQAKAEAEQAAMDAAGVSIAPIHRNEKLRYVGLMGPAIGLGMQMAGIGRPDTSGIMAAASRAGQPPVLASYRPIGEYLKYNPFDINYAANQLRSTSAGNRRDILNSNASAGARNAMLLAQNFNDQNSLGNLYRQAQEYNNQHRAQVSNFNRGTDQFNAQASTQTSQFNTDAINRNRQYASQMAMQAAREKMDADAGWYQGIYGNIGALAKGISDLGRENAQRNMIADMAANGIFGTATPNTYGFNTLIKYVDKDGNPMVKDANGKWVKAAAKGGKIKKKKGFTF